MNVLCMRIFLYLLSSPFAGLLAKLSRQSLSLLHLLKWFIVRQVCGHIVDFCLHFTCVWWGWKFPKLAPTWLEFSRTECWNCWRSPWRNFPRPVDCLRFQRVSTLLTRTCSVCPGIHSYFILFKNICFWVYFLNLKWTMQNS